MGLHVERPGVLLLQLVLSVAHPEPRSYETSGAEEDGVAASAYLVSDRNSW